MISIELSDKEAELFKVFQKHYDSFMFLVAKGAFEAKSGKVEFHKDAKGIVHKVMITYAHKRPIDTR